MTTSCDVTTRRTAERTGLGWSRRGWGRVHVVRPITQRACKVCRRVAYTCTARFGCIHVGGGRDLMGKGGVGALSTKMCASNNLCIYMYVQCVHVFYIIIFLHIIECILSKKIKFNAIFCLTQKLDKISQVSFCKIKSCFYRTCTFCKRMWCQI